MSHVYGIDDAGAKYVKQVQEICKDVIAKAAPDVDAKGRFPEESIKALADAGFLGLCLPTSVGGKGQGPDVYAAVNEEISTACASTGMIFNMHMSSVVTIAGSTILEGKDDILREFTSGKALSSVMNTEKGSRSQFWMPVSRLEPSGDGFVTNAVKGFVTSATHAKYFFSIGMKPGANAPAGPADTVLYLVRKGDSVKPGAPFDGMGLRGNDSRTVTLENYKVAKGDLISPLGEGTGTLLGPTHLPWWIAGTCAVAHGLCRAMIATTTEHLKAGTFENSKTQLRDLPNLRMRLGEMMTRTEQSRALLGHTLSLMKAGSDAVPLYLLQSRLSAIRTAVEVSEIAMQTCGGAAYAKALPLERYFRDAHAGWVMGPTADVVADIIGKALTGLPLL